MQNKTFIQLKQLKMKEYVKINIASPQRILEWTERILPDRKKVGRITKAVE